MGIETRRQHSPPGSRRYFVGDSLSTREGNLMPTTRSAKDASNYGFQPAFSKDALPLSLGEVAEHSEAGEGIGPLSHLR